MSERKDIYQQITNRIIQQLENGVRPWLRPWDANSLPVLLTQSTDKPSRGINVLILMHAIKHRRQAIVCLSGHLQADVGIGLASRMANTES